jgi:FkbM family methyltransferase
MFFHKVSLAGQLLREPRTLYRAVVDRTFSSTIITRRASLAGVAPALVLDVGANVGQFARAARAEWPKASIVSFEPVPETFRILVENTPDNEKGSCFNIALGRHSGKISVNVCSDSQCSSVLNPIWNSGNAADRAKSERVVEVPLDRLDAQIDPSDVLGAVLLKLDVQGYEHEVLAGAEALLPHVDHIIIECSFTQMYEGEPGFAATYELVTGLGFEFVVPLNVLSDARDLSFVQMDCLFRRRHLSRI